MKKFLWVFIILLFAWGGCNNDNSTQNTTPSITGMTPNQVENGASNVAGTINGTNLTGVTKVDLGAGITVGDYHAVSASAVSVTFSVDVNAAAGPRTVVVTTANGAASASALAVVVNNKPPVAVLRVSPAKGDTNTVFHFDGSRSHDPDGRVAEFNWAFDDGKRGSGKAIDHKFANAGKFSVELSVKDNKGLVSKDTVNVNVEKVTAIRCTHHLAYKRIGIFGTILAVDGQSYKWKAEGDHDCSNTFYYCGDFANPSETEYYGTVCGLTDLGESTFIVDTQHRHTIPPAGQRAFIKAQKCKFDPCH
jgi:PKD domain